MVLAEFTFWDAVGALAVFMFMLMYIAVFVCLFIDIFGRSDLTGWGKAGWILLLFVLPLIGALAYVVRRQVADRHAATRAAGTPTAARPAH
jgi:hypothetical protein